MDLPEFTRLSWLWPADSSYLVGELGSHLWVEEQTEKKKTLDTGLCSQYSVDEIVDRLSVSAQSVGKVIIKLDVWILLDHLLLFKLICLK